MAGLRFAVLFAATSAVLLLAASATSRSPAMYVVGDQMGWAVPPGGATGALNEWAARHRFLVGDVWISSTATATRCSWCARATTSGAARRARGAPARCEAGQRMAVRVVNARRRSLTSGAPTPAPTPAPGTLTSDTPHRRPLSLAQKQFAAAAIGFGAGFILTYFIVWLCVCCGG
nr:uncharacterized protein LOC117844290 [Setaria viridis]